MSTAFAALERTRASLQDLIAAAAAEVEAEQGRQAADAAQAVEEAAAAAYDAGQRAGRAIGAQQMRERILAVLSLQLDALISSGVNSMRLDALILGIQSMEVEP